MVRIEIHLDKTETDILDAIAKEEGSSLDTNGLLVQHGTDKKA